jgi:hypothetical protein
MRWPARMVGSGRLTPTDRDYLHACVHVAGLDSQQPASWWGLCALLSRHQVQHGSIRPMPELWSELLPFLFIEDERTAELAVKEYLVYLGNPRRADLYWLGLQINEALDRSDCWRDAIGAVLERPAAVFDARWMALLSYQSLLAVRRAVVLYDSDIARTRRRSYWHGLPVFGEPVTRPPRARAPGPDVRPGARPVPAGSRRFRPTVVPTSLS